MSRRLSIWIGYDSRETAAFAVARRSVRRHLTQPIPVNGVVLADLQMRGLYTRPMVIDNSRPGVVTMHDVISDAPQSTEHANARFLVPHLAEEGWALFMDGDILCRGNLARLFPTLSERFAVYCVKHIHEPPVGIKMDGQVQTQYARKNWSSVVVWNIGHPANRALSLEAVNTRTGRDLHRFFWLDDELIGELDPKYNFLVGHSSPEIDPCLVHFTAGTPDMPGYENVPYAAEWRDELRRWALNG